MMRKEDRKKREGGEEEERRRRGGEKEEKEKDMNDGRDLYDEGCTWCYSERGSLQQSIVGSPGNTLDTDYVK